MCPGAVCEAAGRQAGPEAHHAVTALEAVLVLLDRYSHYGRPTMKALENPSLCHCTTEALLQWDGVTAGPAVCPALG